LRPPSLPDTSRPSRSCDGLPRPRPRPRPHGCLREGGRCHGLGRIRPATCARNLARGLCPIGTGPVRLTACPSGQRLKFEPIRLPMPDDPSLKCRRVRAVSCDVRYGYVLIHCRVATSTPSGVRPRPRAEAWSGRLPAPGQGRLPAPGTWPVASVPSDRAPYVRLLALQGSGSSLGLSAPRCRSIRVSSADGYGPNRAAFDTITCVRDPRPAGRCPVAPGPVCCGWRRLLPPSVPRGSRAVSSPGQYPVAHGPSVPLVSSPWLTSRQFPGSDPLGSRAVSFRVRPRGAQAVSSPSRRRRSRPWSVPLAKGLTVPPCGLHPGRVRAFRHVRVRHVRAWRAGFRVVVRYE